MSERLDCLYDAWNIGMFFGRLCSLFQATYSVWAILNRGPKRAPVRNTRTRADEAMWAIFFCMFFVPVACVCVYVRVPMHYGHNKNRRIAMTDYLSLASIAIQRM